MGNKDFKQFNVVLQDDNSSKEGYKYLCMKCHHIGYTKESFIGEGKMRNGKSQVGEIYYNDELILVSNEAFSCEKCGNRHFSETEKLYIHQLYLKETDDSFSFRAYGQFYEVFHRVIDNQSDTPKTFIYRSVIDSLFELHGDKPQQTFSGFGMDEGSEKREPQDAFLGATDVRLSVKLCKKTKKMTLVSKGVNKRISIINYGGGLDAHAREVFKVLPEFFIEKMKEFLANSIHPEVLKEWGIDEYKGSAFKGMEFVGDGNLVKLIRLATLSYLPNLSFASTFIDLDQCKLDSYTRQKIRKSTSQLDFYRSFIPSITTKGVKELKELLGGLDHYRANVSSFALSLFDNGDYVRDCLTMMRKSDLYTRFTLDISITIFKKRGVIELSNKKAKKIIKQWMLIEDFEKSFTELVKVHTYLEVESLTHDVFRIYCSLMESLVYLNQFIQDNPSHEMVKEYEEQIASIHEFNNRRYYSIRRLHDDLVLLSKGISTDVRVIPYTEKEQSRFTFAAEGHRFELPISTRDLDVVGETMGICVGSYGSEAVAKKVTIVVAYNEESKPVLCLEIKANRILQVKKSRNNCLNLLKEVDLPLISIFNSYVNHTALEIATPDLSESGLMKKTFSTELCSLSYVEQLERLNEERINKGKQVSENNKLIHEDPFANQAFIPAAVINEGDIELPF